MNTGELQVERRTLGEITILDCSGRIVVRRETEFLFDAASFAIEHSRTVLLNLSRVTSIDSGGLGTLILLSRLAKTFSADLKLCGADGCVLELIKLTGLHKVLNLFPSEEDAIETCFNNMMKAPLSKIEPCRVQLRYSAA